MTEIGGNPPKKVPSVRLNLQRLFGTCFPGSVPRSLKPIEKLKNGYAFSTVVQTVPEAPFRTSLYL